MRISLIHNHAVKLTLLLIEGGRPVQRVASLEGLLDPLVPLSEEESADEKPEGGHPGPSHHGGQPSQEGLSQFLSPLKI